MTEQNTLDKINGWATNKYASASPSLMSASSADQGTPTAMAGPQGLLSAATFTSVGAAPTTSSAGAAPITSVGVSPNSVAAPKVNVSDWYRSALGRDGDAEGVSFWQRAIDSGADASKTYADFLDAAKGHKEKVSTTPTTWQQASSYQGPKSSDSGTVVDDWSRNVLGRDLSIEEKAKWGDAVTGAKDPATLYAVYQNFLRENEAGIKNQMDFASASQISQKRDIASSPYTIDPGELAVRNINAGTETVRGQIGSLLAEDSPVLQQARADAMRNASDRGLMNSSMAASGGTDALIRAATGIATTDSGYYNEASNYNTAAKNQLTMWNAEQINQYRTLEKQIGSEAAARQMQLDIAKMNNDTTKAGQAQQLTIAQLQNDTTRAGQTQQMTLSQMQDATTRWQVEQNNANSRYNTDTNYKKDVDNQKLGVANNIIQNMEMSPDRKAAMLEQLGFGTSAANGKPGTGLAGAVYVIDSVVPDLVAAPGGGGGGSGGGENIHNQGGTVGGD